jgi:hypothetical protein
MKSQYGASIKARMKKDLKERWLAALRSKDYEQGRNYLAKIALNGNRYHCCLGVLCDLATKDEVISQEVSSLEPGRLHRLIGFAGALSLPGNEIDVWTGLEVTATDSSRNDGEAYPIDFYTVLAEKNDQGATFEEIADFIDKNVEGY